MSDIIVPAELLTDLTRALRELTRALAKSARNLPVAPSNPPVPAAPLRDTHGWNTEERKRLLREMYPADRPKDVIMPALAALPGPPLPRWEKVQAYANIVLKVRRADPEGLRAHVAQSRVVTMAPLPPYTPAPAASRRTRSMNDTPSVAAREIAAAEAEERAGVPMDLDTALEWGVRNKVKLTGNPTKDFAAVNQFRRDNGLPAYRLVMPRGRPEPLPGVHVGD